MFELILNGNNTYKPAKSGNCFITGYVYNSDGKIFKDKEAASFIQEITLNNDFAANKQISGIYSAVIVEEDRIIITCDIVNFFPIYFVFYENKWIVSDSWNKLVKIKGGLKINNKEADGFLCAGFTSGYNTLDTDIQKTRAGSNIFLYANGEIETKTVYSFLPDNFLLDSERNLTLHAENIFLQSGKRMCEFLDGRTAVVPLSGGFDSRLIACLLKLLNYKKVICFTYGRHTSEVDISQRTAMKLGFEWHFINYEEIDYKGFTKDSDFLNYTQSYAGGYSMVYLQEYFAVKSLKENNIIPSDSVFLPGHSGDFLGGSYVNRTVKTSLSKIELWSFIENKYYFFRKKSEIEKDNIREIIKNCFSEYPINKYSKKYNPFVEDWDIKEKLSKFIFRSSFVFTHFGYEHYYPFWDRQIVDFWRNVPFELRSGKILYDKILTERFFVPLGVFYDESEIKKSTFFKKYQNIKDKIRYFFPWFWVYKRMLKNDWLFYSGFTQEMENEMVAKKLNELREYKSFNAIICRWYLEKQKEELF